LTGADPGAGPIVAVGEALVDLVPAGPNLFEAAPGGSPANVAVGLARLGAPAFLAARLADDLLGRRLRAHLANNGVDLSLAVRASEPTSLAIVALGPDGAPEYDFRTDGTADFQWTDAELAPILDQPLAALHTGSIGATTLPGAGPVTRLAQRAAARATVCYDPNCRPPLMGRPEAVWVRMEQLIRAADVVKVSAEDLTWLLPGRAPAAVAEAWLELGPALVVVTLGAQGAVAVTERGGLVRRPGCPVAVVDTVGAGDAFTSALLYGLHQRRLLGAARRPELRALDAGVLAELLDTAILASALTCARRGADPPTAARLKAGI
jgi:fructokinase